MDAHGAMEAIREDGGRIGNMPPMRFDHAPGLPPQDGERPPSVRPRGQNLLREDGVKAYSDFRQVCLLWLKATEFRASAIAYAFQVEAGEEGLGHTSLIFNLPRRSNGPASMKRHMRRCHVSFGRFRAIVSAGETRSSGAHSGIL